MDQAAFTEKMQAYGQTLYRTARSMLRSDDDCQDALQEAVLKAWAGRDRLREERFFCTWLTRIVINECRNIQRRKARMPLSNQLDHAADIAVPEGNGIMALVDALPEKQRLAVALHYVQGMPIAEAARILRVPQSTVRGRLFEARKALRLELTQEEEARAK